MISKMVDSLTEIKEKSFLVSSIFLIVIESVISFITTLLPSWLINFFTKTTKALFSLVDLTFFQNDDVHTKLIKEMNKKDVSTVDSIYSRIHYLQKAENVEQMCLLFGYQVETHLVVTKDQYVLTLHRLNPLKNNKRPNGHVVYLHHGLLMNSEVWCCMLRKNQNLPFVLCDLGYDVWLGNNRGNKYSNKSLLYNINDTKFWDFSIDEFAIYDIPASIDYVLSITKIAKITYIGFSQGSTQGLAALSTNNKLNHQIDKIITISPATTPSGLHNWLINALFKLSPNLIFLLFGRKILLVSLTFWQSIIYPPLYIKIIDFSNSVLFNWKSLNIDYKQKFSSYYHLYSTTSVKSICHWFQIIKSRKFQMYNHQFHSIYKINLQSLEFPTDTNIEIPILIVYGMIDSLVDIEVMKNQLPKDNLKIIGVENHEHLDLIWGKDVDKLVIPNILKFLVDEVLVDGEGINIRTKNRMLQENSWDNFKTIGEE